MKTTPRQRLHTALDYVYDYDRQIKYHDAEASRLRKIREGYKAKVQRAVRALEREALKKEPL